jgi:hypothetical protein
MFIRLEKRGVFGGRDVFDGLCEAETDLPAADGEIEYDGRRVRLGVGSLVYCLESGAVLARTGTGSWEGATG